MTIEKKLKELVLSRYNSMKDFADKCGIKYNTVMSIFSRGVNKASVLHIIKICQTLGIDTEALGRGLIIFVDKKDQEYQKIEILKSQFEFLMNEGLITLEDEPLSEDEKYFLLDAIEINLELLRRKRIRDKFTEALND